jgi:hypothetical protein
MPVLVFRDAAANRAEASAAPVHVYAGLPQQRFVKGGLMLAQDARSNSAHVQGNSMLTCITAQGMDATHSPTATTGTATLPRKGAARSGLRAFLVVRHCDHGFLLLEVSAKP